MLDNPQVYYFVSFTCLLEDVGELKQIMMTTVTITPPMTITMAVHVPYKTL